MQMILKNKKIDKKFNAYLDKFSFKKTFKPNYTTLSMLRFSNRYSLKNKKVLDLGCGSGIITACLHQKKNNSKFFLSDLSKDSINTANQNLNKIKMNYEIKFGDCFKPWRGQKFDVIINDISGVSKKIAKISPWFKRIPTDKSDAGNYLLKKVLKESPLYMKTNSILITPIISLSKVNDSINYIKKNFQIQRLKKFEWPLPKEMKKYERILKIYKKKKLIDFDYKFGTVICYTLVLSLKRK